MADENNAENIEEQTTETVNDPTPTQVDGGEAVEQPEPEHDTADTANIEPRLDALEKKVAEYHEESDTTDLLETFSTYCECFFSKQKAAEKLHLHRNTLAYRLASKRQTIRTCE